MFSLVWFVILSSVLWLMKGTANSRNYSCGPLYITISASPKPYVVLNWQFTCSDHPDTLLLLLSDSRSYEQIHDSVDVKNKQQGSHRTKYEFPREPDFPGNWNEGDENPELGVHCLPLVVESLRNGNMVDRKCLEIHPTWMAKYGKLRLGSMMIPGTHDSGSYKGMPFLVKNWVLNQDRNWWQQLIFGIRYFDVRLGVYKHNEVFLTHNVARCTQLEPELDHIANFLRKSPKEVVILDIHAFNNPVNFSSDDHRTILNLIKKKLGKFIYFRQKLHYEEGPTLEEVWSSGRQVIISYNQANIVNDNDWLWYKINRDWGNVISVDKLRNYINSQTERKQYGNPMRVLMAELTPTKTFVVFHLTSSLKQLADSVNQHLGFWLRNGNRSDNVNIIATDFFLGNDMVNLAQETNDRKVFRLS